MLYCINKCNFNCEKKLENAKINGKYLFGRLEGFPSICPKANGAPVDKTDAPKIYRGCSD